MSQRPSPNATHLVEVRLRAEFADAEGAAALALLRAEGLSPLREARVLRLYEIKGALSAGQVQQAAKDLLSDAVTQEHRLVAPAPLLANGMSAWRVEVWPRPGVCDPVGETVREALAGMGLPRPESVRCALVYQIAGRSNRAALEKAVAKCLANPLIQSAIVSEAHP